MQPVDRRDLDPHKAARFAMWFFHERYSRQRLGSMGFWDSLTERDRDMCREAVREILAARDE